jgi:hypothetical protein
MGAVCIGEKEASEEEIKESDEGCCFLRKTERREMRRVGGFGGGLRGKTKVGVGGGMGDVPLIE